MKNGPYNLVIAPIQYPGKKYRNRYAYEHTVIYWKNYGLIPSKGFEIHHLNGDHRDNRIDNLKLVTSKEHKRIHGLEIKEKAKIRFNCGWCNKDQIKKGNSYRNKMKKNKYGKLFCSISCGAKHQHSGVAKQVRHGPVKTAIAGAIPAPGAILAYSSIG